MAPRLIRLLLLSVAGLAVYGLEVWLLVSLGYAHPGRLDAQGCHHTRKDFRYETGEVISADTYHCHRPLGMLKLDSREVLQEPDARGEEVEPRPQEVR